MGNGQPRLPRKRKESASRAEKKHIPRSTAGKEAYGETTQFDIFKCVFDSAPDGKMICDQEGKILRINAAALNLFALSSKRLCLGKSYQQFLESYKIHDEQQQSASPEPWLLGLALGEGTPSSSQEEVMTLQIPFGRQIYVDMRCSPLFDTQQHDVGILVILRDITHQYQKALRIQYVHEALLILRETIARIPASRDSGEPLADLLSHAENVLLSPPVLFIAQQLVDLIRGVLNGQKVSLFANVPPAAQTYYIVGSGFTAEQEQHRREIRGRFFLSDFLDQTMLARLSANQEVILPAGFPRIPQGYQSAFGHTALLLVPLVLDGQLVGSFLIAKDGRGNAYTAEEIAFVHVVAEQSLLIIECLLHWDRHRTNHGGELAQQEMKYLISDFLNLASHELKTPLTVIKGNIQLAQRRIAKLKQQIMEQPERVDENVERIQQALGSASQSARLQERMIHDLIDDARIQANRLELDMKRSDLGAILREVVAEQQRIVPERTITLASVPAEKEALIIADAARVKQVITTYLANALKHSPSDRPVTVQLTIAESTARVSVRDEGPGIPTEEQQHLWERFYRGKGAAVQHELDLSLGLGLYLCKVFIEQHHGSVGVQNNADHGVIFWFTLPIITSPGE